MRGNIQPGDVILRVITRGVPTEAKSAAQLNDVLAKLDEEAPVTLQVKRGENQFFATVRLLAPDTE